jgi:hypothetical protein
MPATITSATSSRPLMAFGLAAGLLILATLVLWAYFGTTVFFEMVRAGWMACF